LSRRLLLITVTGRRSGRTFTIPVSYVEEDGRLLIQPSAPERKLWWRNLRGGAPVRVRLRGQDRTGQAVAHGDERAGVRVEVTLD
jgi:deazaflavin-dependent oxidoreductase (nitroreductase family)